jgi:hypothetical protein
MIAVAGTARLADGRAPRGLAMRAEPGWRL